MGECRNKSKVWDKKNSFEVASYHEVLVEPVLHDDELLEVLDLDGARTLEVATIRVVLLGRAEIRIVKMLQLWS